ncbi:hypothetical protein AA309_15210 [Microvirga vignae]|uniref:Extensin-like C-terminal domain-containing protein n=2 Tax=Microvirga vignae TaxID=1225564 RepID=A0A0H1RIH5_9HYPH|nr:hypothetical protein AA309_15210 [Microvirga vignae]
MAVALPGAGASQEQNPPLPPPRPDRPAPPEKPDGKSPVRESAEQNATDAGDPAAACIERLTKLGLRFEKRPPVQENACRIGNPVSVSALPTGIEVSPASLMECSFAEGLVRWVNEVVIPRTGEHFQSAPTKLLIGTSYQCRDQRSGAKLSEHAFGNSVDVMGFEFDKRPPLTVRVQPEGSPEAAFQSAVQKEACAIFSTVLGPGADDDHDDHLHLDMRVRKADYRICQ